MGGNSGDAQHELVGDLDRGEHFAGDMESCAQLAGGVLPQPYETGRVRVIGEPPTYNLDSSGRVGKGLTLHAKTKAVEKLWTQFSLFRVHRPHQDERGLCSMRDTISLNMDEARGCGIEEDIHKVVFQQINLIDVEDTTICLGEKPGLKVVVRGFQNCR